MTTARIPLSRGEFAIIDEADLPFVSQTTWRAHPCNRQRGGFYAASDRGYMHRLIMSASKNQLVDHINGDGLDNRRINLRIASHRENCINSIVANSTGFRGVEALPSGKWRAKVCVHKKPYRSAPFATVEEAAAAYDELAQIHHGDFAILNFPDRAA